MGVTIPQKDWQAGQAVAAADLDTYLSANMKAVIDTVLPAGVAALFLNPSEFILSRGSAARAMVGSAGNELRMDAWAFDPATDEAINTQIYTPWDPTLGLMTAQILWAPSSTNTGIVAWQVMIADIASGEQIDQAAEETVSLAQAGTGTLDALLLTTDSATITRTGRFQRLSVYRNADDAGDTFTGDAWFLGLLLKFTPT